MAYVQQNAPNVNARCSKIEVFLCRAEVIRLPVSLDRCVQRVLSRTSRDLLRGRRLKRLNTRCGSGASLVRTARELARTRTVCSPQPRAVPAVPHLRAGVGLVVPGQRRARLFSARGPGPGAAPPGGAPALGLCGAPRCGPVRAARLVGVARRGEGKRAHGSEERCVHVPLPTEG